MPKKRATRGLMHARPWEKQGISPCLAFGSGFFSERVYQKGKASPTWERRFL